VHAPGRTSEPDLALRGVNSPLASPLARAKNRPVKLPMSGKCQSPLHACSPPQGEHGRTPDRARVGGAGGEPAQVHARMDLRAVRRAAAVWRAGAGQARMFRLSPGDLVLVDEAGMAGTFMLDQLVQLASWPGRRSEISAYLTAPRPSASSTWSMQIDLLRMPDARPGRAALVHRSGFAALDSERSADCRGTAWGRPLVRGTPGCARFTA
jgi:hypothetical protein